MRRRRYARADWIALGQERLAAEGPEAVKLEAICKAAGVTRGSFYHHFEDHRSFLTALANAWMESGTNDVAARIDRDLSVSERMEALTSAAIQIDYRLELGIRELARRLPEVADIVAAADATRLTFLTGLYRERFGLDEAEARAFAMLEYAAFSGLILLDPDLSGDRQRALATLYSHMVAKALEARHAS